MSCFFEQKENSLRSIEIPAKLENIDALINEIMEDIQSQNINKKVRYQIMLACEEALINIVQYAYPNMNGNINVFITNSKNNDEIIIEIVDSGIPFNPLSIAEPDLNTSFEVRSKGGLGIFLMKKVIDDVRYERKGEENILTFVKKF